MPAPLHRTEYYWEGGRITLSVNRRSGKNRPWPETTRTPSMVVAIEDWGDEYKFKPGDEWRPFRAIYAMLHHTRRTVVTSTPDIGPGVPQVVVDAAAAILANAADRVTRHFRAIGTEEGMTGAFTMDVNDAQTTQIDDWEVTIVTQSFSPEVKESEMGADFSVIVDIRHQGQQVSKAALVQAKIATAPGARMGSLTDLPDQIGDMRRHTEEAYAAVYTPAGMEVFRGDDPTSRFPMRQFASDLIRCTRGDRSPRLIANCTDYSYTIELILMGPGSQQTLRPKVTL